MKTGILPSYDFMDDIDVQDLESDDLNDINVDYLKMFDSEISTEEFLTDNQIVNLVQTEGKENDDNDISSDEEISPISAKDGINGLKTFINFFEQQDDPEYNVKDLHMFRKYLRISKAKEFNSKTQSTLDMFF
jgi:hypothetical protein